MIAAGDIAPAGLEGLDPEEMGRGTEPFRRDCINPFNSGRSAFQPCAAMTAKRPV